DFTKGDSRLHHSKRTGVHPEENDALRTVGELPKVRFVRLPGVLQRVINMRDWQAETEGFDAIRQLLCGRDQVPGAPAYRAWSFFHQCPQGLFSSRRVSFRRRVRHPNTAPHWTFDIGFIVKGSRSGTSLSGPLTRSVSFTG